MCGKISSSIMCADFGNLKEVLRQHEQEGIEYIHVDIMDGGFVPNFTFGPDFVKALRGLTKIPMDIHLMVENPERFSAIWDIRPGDFVTLHVESTRHIQRALTQYQTAGARTGVAINPGTPIEWIEEVLPDIDMVLIMTVNPGFAGQVLVPQSLDKIAKLRRFLDDMGFPEIRIEVDGNVSFENAKRMREKGANIFVAGSSSLYKKDLTFHEAAKMLRQAIS